MRRLVRFSAIAAVALSFLAVPARAAYALPSSSCAPNSSPPPLFICSFVETAAGAPAEISDTLTLLGPPSSGPIYVAIVENPGAAQNDPHNWSDVVEFLPPGPVNPNSETARMVSAGCGTTPDNETDISCFPPAPVVTHFFAEAGTTGNDFQDCTPFQAFDPTGAPYAFGQACSDAPVNEQPGPSIPEVPLAAMLPLAALGVIGTTGLRRWRRRSAR